MSNLSFKETVLSIANYFILVHWVIQERFKRGETKRKTKEKSWVKHTL